MAYFLTADGGTESIRARVYDLSGACIASEAVPYETKFSSGARAEQEPEDWWRCFVRAARKAMEASGVDGARSSPSALRRPAAPLSPSTRPERLCVRRSSGWTCAPTRRPGPFSPPATKPLQVNGAGNGPVSAEWMIPKALWIKRNEPEVFERAHTICEYQDFMTLRLTGERAASLDNVSLRWHYSHRPRRLARLAARKPRPRRAEGQMAVAGRRPRRGDRHAFERGRGANWA